MTSVVTSGQSKEPAALAVAGSRPYRWPYDGVIDPATLALSIVTGPGLAAGDRQQAIEAIEPVATGMRECGATVVWVACSGSDLPSTVAGDLAVEAPTANGFLGSGLDLVLRTRKLDKLVFAGWPTEICVHSTLRRANDLGFECLVLEDACKPSDPTLNESAISQILMSGGIFGAVGSSVALINAVAGEATPRPQGDGRL